MTLLLKELLFCLLLSLLNCDVKVSLKVLSPPSLHSLLFPHISVGYFGQIPYGKKISSTVVIPPSQDLCSLSDSKSSPIFLAKDGNCSLETKAHNAQLSGATVLIIISSEDQYLTGHMEGKIATLMLSGDDSLLLWEVALQEDVVISVGFGKPIGRAKSDVEFWMDSTGIDGYEFLKAAFEDYRILDMIEQKRITFKPRYTIYYCSQCIDADFTSENSNCISGGRYCSPDPDQIDGYNGPVTGRDAVSENLRQICIYQTYWNYQYYDWLNYEILFYDKCVRNITDKPGDFDLKTCGDNIIKTLNLDNYAIQQCIDNSFKLNGENTLLHQEMSSFVGEGIQIWPALYINDLNFRGDLENIDYVVEVICESISDARQLHYCTNSLQEEDSGAGKGVSLGLVIIIVIFTIIFATFFMYWLYNRKIKKELQDDFQVQISTAISQYIALGEERKKY